MTAPPPAAPLILILGVQAASAASELFGQRLSRRCHHHSAIRMLISMSTFCFVQSFVVLGAAELLLPVSLTGGQGSLSVWSIVLRHPWLLGNAVNNSIYWTAMAVLLREPLGSLLIVLAFLSGSFLVDPLLQLLDSSSSDATASTASSNVKASLILLSIVGSAMCAVDVPLRTSEAVFSCITGRRWWRELVVPRGGYVGIASPPHQQQQASLDSSSVDYDEHVHDGEEGGASPSHPSAASASSSFSCGRAPCVALAFAVLAGTTGVGVVFATFSELYANLTPFGYTAVDQLLLPLTTLPLAAFLGAFYWTRNLIGEPPWDEGEACAASRPHRRAGAAGVSAIVLDALPAAADDERRGRTSSQSRGEGPVSTSSSSGSSSVSSLMSAEVPLPSFGAQLRRTWEEVNASAAAAESTPLFRSRHAGIIITDAPAVVASASSDESAASVNSPHSAISPTAVAAAAARSGPSRSASGAPTGAIDDHEEDAREHGVCVSLRKPRSFWWTLVPFHGIELCRSLFFFYLVTAFDVGITYFTMTLVRIAIVWVGSAVACTWLRVWVGISVLEARATLHPVALCGKLFGTALLLSALAVAREKT